MTLLCWYELLCSPILVILTSVHYAEHPYDLVSSSLAPSSMASTPSIIGLVMRTSTVSVATGPAISSSFPGYPNGGVLPSQVQGMSQNMDAAILC